MMVENQGESGVAAASGGWDNPMGTDGFEFVEYTAPDVAALGNLFERLGFSAVARHRSKKVTLYRQGDVNFIVNGEPESFAQACARRTAGSRQGGPDGAQHSGDRRYWRQPALSCRPLWRAQHL